MRGRIRAPITKHSWSLVTWLRLRLLLSKWIDDSKRVISCNLVTVTVTQTHGERVTHLHSSLVTWLRGYVVTQIFSNKILNFFFNRNRNRNQRNLVTVTVTQTHGERVTHLHSSLVTWLRGYVVTQLFYQFFQLT